VKPLTSGFDPEADATQLKNCLKSSFLNETVIVNILPHRSNAQRQKIRLMYKTMYGKVFNNCHALFVIYFLAIIYSLEILFVLFCHWPFHLYTIIQTCHV